MFAGWGVAIETLCEGGYFKRKGDVLGRTSGGALNNVKDELWTINLIVLQYPLQKRY